MSRTRKDRPWRVKRAENVARGLIDHDHRNGPCDAVDDPTRPKRWHKPGCSRIKRVTTYCEAPDRKAVKTGVYTATTLLKLKGITEENAAAFVAGTYSVQWWHHGTSHCHLLVPGELSGLDHWQWTGCIGHPSWEVDPGGCDCPPVRHCEGSWDGIFFHYKNLNERDRHDRAKTRDTLNNVRRDSNTRTA